MCVAFLSFDWARMQFPRHLLIIRLLLSAIVCFMDIELSILCRDGFSCAVEGCGGGCSVVSGEHTCNNSHNSYPTCTLETAQSIRHPKFLQQAIHGQYI
jgi:hypothetical protein